jgi:hypothetical protein
VCTPLVRRIAEQAKEPGIPKSQSIIVGHGSGMDWVA